jgi:hypothetical protein
MMGKIFTKLDHVVLFLYTIALSILFLIPLENISERLRGSGGDKIVHVVLFAGFACLLYWNMHRLARAITITIIGTVALVLVLELVQHWLPYRNAHLGDSFAGLTGTGIGTLCAIRLLGPEAQPKIVWLIVAMLGLVVTLLFGRMIVGNPDLVTIPAIGHFFGSAIGLILMTVSAWRLVSLRHPQQDFHRN